MQSDPDAPRARPQPAAIVSRALTPRRVFIRDPDGVSLLRGEALLVEERVLGEMVLLCKLRLGGGVEAVLPPSWIVTLPAALADNVRPFPRREAAPCR